MVQTLDRDYLKNHLEQTKRHDTGKVLDILPFSSNRKKSIRGQFNQILGEYIRNICEFELNNKAFKEKEFVLSADSHELSEHIATNVDCNDDDDAYDFVRFLDQYLFNQKDIRPIHPFLFNYIEVEKTLKNEVGKYGQFMNGTLVKESPEIKAIFNNKESDDILTELILETLDGIEEKQSQGKNTKSKQYQPLLANFTRIYQEDILYLSKYKDYFLTSFPLLTQYYVFMYTCQLILKFEQFTEANMEDAHPLYFALEWESMSKRRKATDDLESYKYIKENAINLFRHIHTISHISHNSLNKCEDGTEKIKFVPYSTLYQSIKNKGVEYEEDFLKEINQWIQDYLSLSWLNLDSVSVDEAKTIPQAFKLLFNCLKEGTSTDVAKRFGENIGDLGANQFLKTRGNYGQVFNIKHDFLLLLTAVSVKNKRIPLNDLFKELEKRGVAFDRYSKKEIISLFDNLNILDKKSDSGDAQYVKPIL
ncbi:DNA phosphorothioation-dependent restriction protein DptG [Priestia megaterium]